ncbi:MAG TPA: hypothetical protein VJ689_11700 [Gaiellaceae bacterium]|nr:hypothetical protein [Gaiellaceae bacterium]
MSQSAQRAAENEARFREANDRISRTAERLHVDGPLPFICECDRRGCTAILRVELSTYRDVRSSPRRFLAAPGHERESPETRIVERTDGFEVVEKIGEAARVAAELDRRADA